MRGFSEPYGSWKIICILRRARRWSSRESCTRSLPSKITSPAVGGSSCMMVLPVVVLPQPDSPTRPRVSPAFSSKLMPSTARTSPDWRRMMKPRMTGKYFVSPLTVSSVSPLAEPLRLEAVVIVSLALESLIATHPYPRPPSSGATGRRRSPPRGAFPQCTCPARTGSAARTGTPTGRLVMSGGAPGMALSRSPRAAEMLGMDSSRPIV